MRLIMARHGETEWNKQRRIQGCRSDTRLNEKGLQEADRLASLFKTEPIEAIYSSPLKRAAETARLIGEACRLPVQLVSELSEIDAGDLEGLAERELSGAQKAAWKALCAGEMVPLPGGESLADLGKRTAWAVDRILEKHEGSVLIVGHLLVNLAILCQALDVSLGRIGRFRQAPASVTILEMSTRGNNLVLFNDTCHLAG